MKLTVKLLLVKHALSCKTKTILP